MERPAAPEELAVDAQAVRWRYVIWCALGDLDAAPGAIVEVEVIFGGRFIDVLACLLGSAPAMCGPQLMGDHMYVIVFWNGDREIGSSPWNGNLEGAKHHAKTYLVIHKATKSQVINTRTQAVEAEFTS